MRVRWIGLVLVLALVGAAAGYGLGHLRQDEPTTFPVAAPVPAESPSYPVIPTVVRPDPDFPSLQPGLRLHHVTVGTPPYDFGLSVPRGWLRTNPISAEWHWHAPPESVPNTYFVRVKLLGNGFKPVASALAARISDLENAEDVTDLHIESRSADGFVADYVAVDHRRVSMERFVADSTGTTYASIAVIGREADRAGLADLFSRIPGTATTP
jgi:hypothetical protein